VGTVRVVDWSGHQPATRSMFRDYYDGRDGPHPHVHGANLGFRAAYLRAGGFPDIPTAEDHALVASLVADGNRVLRTRAVISARRQARAPHGFSDFLTELNSALTASAPERPQLFTWTPGWGVPRAPARAGDRVRGRRECSPGQPRRR
jgi:hypothetical protein